MSNAFDTSNAASTEPKQIIAGDYIAWKRVDLSAYDNSLFTLTYQCRSEGTPSRKKTITAVADGDTGFLIELSSATTADYDPAIYQWSAFITRDADNARITIKTGSFEVKADQAKTSDDPRAFAKRMLDAVETAMDNRCTNQQLDVLAYDLGTGTSATRDPKQLAWWRGYWRKELVRENRKAKARKGIKHSGTIGVAF